MQLTRSLATRTLHMVDSPEASEPAGRMPITGCRVIGPSWAWRQGMEGVVARVLPNVPRRSHAGLPPAQDLAPGQPGLLALLDGGMSQPVVLDWIQFWHRPTYPALVLVLDVADDTECILSYIAAGIAGYTLLGTDEAAVQVALEDVRDGVARCSPEVTARLFAEAASRAAPALDFPLSPRELTVLRHVAAGHSNQEIANLLMVELCTVKHHVHSILQKLDVRHRWEAASVATASGWLDGPASQDRPAGIHPGSIPNRSHDP